MMDNQAVPSESNPGKESVAPKTSQHRSTSSSSSSSSTSSSSTTTGNSASRKRRRARRHLHRRRKRFRRMGTCRYDTLSRKVGKGRFGASVIRRTASLDTLYHKGQWSRDYYLHAGQLQVDKSTQTDDGGGTSGRSSRSSEDDKLDRFLRSRLQRTHKPSASGDYSSHSMNTTLWSRFGGSSVPLRAARSSVEGLNQEIERLVLFPASGTQTPHLDRLRDKVTPEGHRAPLAELLRRSVNTQTPHDLCHTAHSSGGSVCSSPDLDGSKLGTSPQINRFLAREPPDGCEKVNLKAGEGAFSESVSVMKPTIPGFTLRPSLGSAFQPLQPAPPPSPPASSSH